MSSLYVSFPRSEEVWSQVDNEGRGFVAKLLRRAMMETSAPRGTAQSRKAREDLLGKDTILNNCRWRRERTVGSRALKSADALSSGPVRFVPIAYPSPPAYIGSLIREDHVLYVHEPYCTALTSPQCVGIRQGASVGILRWKEGAEELSGCIGRLSRTVLR